MFGVSGWLAVRSRVLWDDPSFLVFWAARTISLLGDQITNLAIPLLAVLLLGATPAQMGLLAAAAWAPLLLLGLIAGAWLDRLHRRPLLVTMDLARGPAGRHPAWLR
jgi:MFS family permease